MTKKYVYKILPVYVFFDSSKPEHAGLAKGNHVYIKSGYERDTGLLEHELTHVKQFYRYLGLFYCILRLFKKGRLKFEVEAYKKQLQYCLPSEKEELVETFAGYLSSWYDLDITKEEAVKLLQ